MATIFTRRVIAYILDFFVVSVAIWILSYGLFILSNGFAYGIFSRMVYILPFIILFYFILCEKLANATIGKSLMYLQVRSRNGARISWIQAIVRNISKIYWFPIIFDWLLGKFLRTDRIFNNISRTVVIND
ncbi:MAG: RDD family protein [Methanobrevibacter sp.]|nr:RDD family protein [Methanobrevibacter sp.]